MEWPWCPKQCNAVGSVVRVEGAVLQEGTALLGQLKLLVILRHPWVNSLLGVSVADRVDQRIKVERRQVRVLCLDVNNIGSVVPRQVDKLRQVVVQVGEGNPETFGQSDEEI